MKKNMKSDKPELLSAVSIDALPPSVNHAYCRSRRGTFKTAEAKAWQERAAYELFRTRTRQEPYADKVEVRIGMFKRDRRERDLDNLMKLAMDAIQDSGVIRDDRQIYSIVAEKAVGCGRDCLTIEVRTMEQRSDDHADLR